MCRITLSDIVILAGIGFVRTWMSLEVALLKDQLVMELEEIPLRS